MNAEQMTERAAEILRAEVAAGRIPFGAFGVWLGDEMISLTFEGFSDMEARRPAARDTILRLYSMSKPVTAIAAMILVERGLLREDDPVAKYLPEYAHARALGAADAGRPMAVKDLFNMTSGIVYPGEDGAGLAMEALFGELHADIARGEGWPLREVARRIAACPLAFEPGAHWRYGLSADVLGAVIETASGRALSSFLGDEIFSPLGMTDTGFFVPPEKRCRFAQLYRRAGARLEVDPDRHLGLTLCHEPPAFESGGAGLVSTFDDYARFGRMLAGYGQADGVRILREETVRSFEEDQLTNAQRQTLAFAGCEGHGYGRLMRVCVDPAAATSRAEAGEFGWDGWTGVYMSANARRGLFIMFMTQASDSIDATLMVRLRNLVYENL